MTDTALSYLSMTGSMMIFCVGVNLIWDKKIQRCQHAAYADLRRDCRRHLPSITCE